MKNRSFDLKTAHCPDSGVRDPKDRVDHASCDPGGGDGGTGGNAGSCKRPSPAFLCEDRSRLIKDTIFGTGSFGELVMRIDDNDTCLTHAEVY